VYPILEFDPTRKALLEPAEILQPIGAPEHAVACFFAEVIERLVAQERLKLLVHRRWEDTDRPLYELEHGGRRVAVFHPGVGAPLAAGMLEETIALGCRKFIACGGCGVLDRELAVGHLLVPTQALRDEGVSYHYLPPAREVSAAPQAVQAIEATLQRGDVAYRLVKTWTTDAPYRETQPKILRRKEEGCLAVEMEAAAFFAVAQFRQVNFGQILYAGDDISGDAWDHREWQSRGEIREALFWLAVEACLSF
jgi:uridine phosphorylase